MKGLIASLFLSDFNLNPNQFSLQPLVGEIDLTFFGGENVVGCVYNPTASSSDTLVPGEAVKLIDLGSSDPSGGTSAGSPPIVDAMTANTQATFGVVVRTSKQATYKPGARIQVALFGCPVWMQSTDALNRGVQVTADYANPGKVIALSATTLLGITLDKIPAGGLGRVLIQAQGVAG